MFSVIVLLYTFCHVTKVKSETMLKSILILLSLKQKNKFLKIYSYSAKLEFYHKNIRLMMCYFPQ